MLRYLNNSSKDITRIDKMPIHFFQINLSNNKIKKIENLHNNIDE